MPVSPRKIPTNPSPPGRCFKISNCVTFTYNPVTSQTAAYMLVLRTHESVHQPCKRSFSHPHSSSNPLDTTTFGFQSQLFLGPHLSGCRSQGLGCVMWGTKSLFLGEASGPWVSSLWCVAMLEVRFLARTHVCLSYLSGGVPFIPCGRSCSASCQFFFSRNYSIYSCSFAVSVEESEFSVFLCCHPVTDLKTNKNVNQLNVFAEEIFIEHVVYDSVLGPGGKALDKTKIPALWNLQWRVLTNWASRWLRVQDNHKWYGDN